MATRKTTKTAKKSMVATEATEATVIDSGVITSAAQLDQFLVRTDNVRNWTEYDLDFTQIPLGADQTSYAVTIASNNEKIQQLWHNLFTIEDGRASFKVTTPIVVVPTEDGRYSTVIGNSRILLAQQIKQGVETGLLPLDVTWEIPYTVKQGLTNQEIILSQITGNGEVPLTVWNQYAVIKLAVEGTEDTSKKGFLATAKSVYPPGNSLVYRLADMYEFEQAGLPVQETAKVIPYLDIALDVFKKWQSLPEGERPPASAIPSECSTIACGDSFTNRHLNLLFNSWLSRTPETTAATDEGETSEASESQSTAPPKPQLAHTWSRSLESIEVLKDALENEPEESENYLKLVNLATKLEQLLDKMSKIVYPKQKEPKKSKAKLLEDLIEAEAVPALPVEPTA